MGSRDDNWIRIFYIPDTSFHNKGFTLYKVISMLYPKNCPDSVTKVTVWKRFNDFKKLHRDIKALHKSLNLKDKFPNLPRSSYFKRFDKEIIEQRRDGILKLLEYVAIHPQLFSSDTCTNFFKTSYTPSEFLSSNINSIRADLKLPLDCDYNLLRSTSDDEHTMSDTESVSTLSSYADQLPDPISKGATQTKRLSASNIDVSLLNSVASCDSLSISTANTSLDEYTILEGLRCVSPKNGTFNYVTEASQHITHAVELETSKQYEEAFNEYKRGIDILLTNVKDDTDFDRKSMVRHKTEKYLLRAEKIYNIHLSSESKVIHNYILEDNSKVEDEIKNIQSDLFKYKVIKIIASGMLTLHLDSQQLFYVKIIDKTVKFSQDKIFLPGNVPYMVKLYNYYNCENALVLVLQYCSGCNLKDYLKQQSTNPLNLLHTKLFKDDTHFSFDTIADKEDDEYNSDSDHSYSDLIQSYTLNKYNDMSLQSEKSDPERDLTKTNALAENETNLIVSKTEDNSTSLSFQQVATSDIKENFRSSRKSSIRSELSVFDDVSTDNAFLFPVKEVVKWAAQLLVCLERLHLLGVICCDLDIGNILIDESNNLRLTYMCNVSEKYDLAFSKERNVLLAPEMCSYVPITEAVDWWSYGVVLYELLVGMSLKYVHPDGVHEYTILKIPNYVSVEGRSLVKQLLAFEPHNRLGNGMNGADDIKLHPFFNSIVWGDIVSKWKVI